MSGIRPVLFAALLLSGCAGDPPPRVVAPDLPTVPRPVLPKLTAEDLACLSEDAYSRVLERDIQRRQYAEKLEAVIGGYQDWARDAHGR